jgi:hypothetical protein
MCNVNNGGINKKFQESALSAATSRTGPRLRTIPASSTPRRKISEIAPYPVSGVSSQHATVSVATPITAVIYSLNGAREGAAETFCSAFVVALIEGSEACGPLGREIDGPITRLL